MPDSYLRHVDIDELAQRARLDITEDEHDALQADIDNILDLVKTLEGVDTSDVDHISMRQCLEPRQLRHDTAEPSCSMETLQRLSPYLDQETQLFLVPQVVES